MNLRVPAARPASITLIVPMMFVSASNCGSFTERRTSICAAWWLTTSGRSCANTSATASASVMETSWKLAPGLMFERRPVARLSMIETSWPSAMKRSTRFDPMKPAPPVTSIFMYVLRVMVGCGARRMIWPTEGPHEWMRLRSIQEVGPVWSSERRWCQRTQGRPRRHSLRSLRLVRPLRAYPPSASASRSVNSCAFCTACAL